MAEVENQIVKREMVMVNSLKHSRDFDLAKSRGLSGHNRSLAIGPTRKSSLRDSDLNRTRVVVQFGRRLVDSKTKIAILSGGERSSQPNRRRFG